MPINFGLHPYFNVSDFKNLEFVDNPLKCQDQERNTISNTLEEVKKINLGVDLLMYTCLLYTSPSPRDTSSSRMPSSA